MSQKRSFTAMRVAMAFKGLCLILVLCLLTPSVSAEQSSEQRLTTTLSAKAKDAADLLHVTDWVQRLFALPHQDQPTDRRAIMMKMIIYKRVMAAILEMRKTTARIDKELAYAYDVQSGLLARRGKMVRYTTIANFSQFGAMGTARTGLLINGKVPEATQNASNYLRIIAASTSVFLASMTVLERRSGKRKIDADPNALAGIFDIDSARAYYLPDVVWNFLNEPPPEGGASRKERLVKQWQTLRHLNPSNTTYIHRITATPLTEEEKTETVRILEDRIFMLHDLHAVVEQLDAELLELVNAVSSSGPMPVAEIESGRGIAMAPDKKADQAEQKELAGKPEGQAH